MVGIGGKNKTSFGTKTIAVLIGFTVLVMIVSSIINPDSAATTSAKEDLHTIGLAEAACQLEIERTANDPDSIDWIRPERTFDYINKEQTQALSKMAFRGKNRFNATVKAIAICKVQKSNTGWDVLEVSEEN